MATAHAAVLTGPRKLEMQDFPLPEIGADDGLLRVEANGLCGTDYHQYRCEYKLDGGKLPIIPGHEPIGWIEKIGANAAKRWEFLRRRPCCPQSAAALWPVPAMQDGGDATLREANGLRSVVADRCGAELVGRILDASLSASRRANEEGPDEYSKRRLDAL